MNASFVLVLVLVIVLAASHHAYAGGILVGGVGISCPAAYPTSFGDIPGAASVIGVQYVQTDMCTTSGMTAGAGSIKYTCDANSTVSQAFFSDVGCTKFVNRLSLGSVNSCIPSLVAGSTIATAAFFSCDSPTALPSFVLKDGGILLSGLSFNQQTGVPATCPANSQSLISQTQFGILLLPVSGDCKPSDQFPIAARASFPDTDGTAMLSYCIPGFTLSFTLPKAPLCNVFSPPNSPPGSGLVYQIFSPTSTGLSSGAIAGIAIGTLAVCSIAGFFAWKYWKRTDSSSSASGSLNDQSGYVGVDTVYMPPPQQMASPHA